MVLNVTQTSDHVMQQTDCVFKCDGMMSDCTDSQRGHGRGHRGRREQRQQQQQSGVKNSVSESNRCAHLNIQRMMSI